MGRSARTRWLLVLVFARPLVAAGLSAEGPWLVSEAEQTYVRPLPQGRPHAIIEVLEAGRDLQLELLDAVGTSLATFETPGQTVGKLLVLWEAKAYPSAHSFRLRAERPSSAAGRFKVAVHLDPTVAQHRVAAAVTEAATLYVHAPRRRDAVAAFRRGADLPGPWLHWRRYWAALAENELGSRERALALLLPLRTGSAPELPALLALALEARLQMYLGALDQAEALYKQLVPALEQRVQLQPSVYRAELVTALEYQCVVVDVYAGKSSGTCERALAEAERLADPYLLGLVEVDLGARAILTRNRPDLALPHLQRSIAHFEAVGAFYWEDQGNAYLTLAKAYELLGRFVEAKAATEAAMRLIEQQPRTANLAWAHHRAAELAQRTGDWPRAVVHAERAVALLQGSADREMLMRAQTLLAQAYIASAEPAAALKAVAAVRAFHRQRCPQLEREPSACGFLLEALKAELLYAKAARLVTADADVAASVATVLRIADKVVLVESSLAALERAAADVFALGGERNHALALLSSALLRYQHSERALSALKVRAERSRLYFADGDFPAAEADARIVTQQLSALEVELAAERMGPTLRSRLFDQFVLRIAALRSMDPTGPLEPIFAIAQASLAPRWILAELPPDPSLDQRLAELAKLQTDPSAWREAGYRARLARRVAAVEARLTALQPRRPKDVEPLSLREVQQALAEDEALLHYLWWGDRGWLLTLERNAAALTELARIDQAALGRLLKVPRHLDAAFAYARWRSLGAKLLPRLGPQIKRLYVVPDGPLRYLPLAALPGNDELRPLLEDYVITYLSSYDRFRRAARTSVDLAAGMVLFANPALEPDITLRQTALSRHYAYRKDSLAVASSTALPWSAREARLITEALGDVAVSAFLGSDANYGNVKAAAGVGRPLWHFATHGSFSSDVADSGGLVLAASANGPRKQGLFTVQDARVAQLQTDLVVLNGCETGLGRTLQGEGVMGMTKAFVHNGAANAVSTLWKVPDRAAQEIIVSFYRALKASRGRDVASALAQAQRQFLSRNRRYRWQPAYWGAYIHYQQ